MRSAKEHRLVACAPSGVELRFDANSTKEQRDNESGQYAGLAHRPQACVPRGSPAMFAAVIDRRYSRK